MIRPIPALLLAITLFLLLSSASAATPQATPTSLPNSASTSISSTPNDCGFKGDTDTYGLGIRVGLYLQWITSSIAYYFVPGEAENMRGVNTSFQAATFGGLLYITISRGLGQPSDALYTVECWIVLSFCLGGVCSGRTRSSPDQRDFSSYKATGLGSLIQLGLVATMSYYALWFVYVGMDTMKATPCSRYAFFFAKVDLFHWFRTLLKITFTLSAVGVTTLLAILIPSLWRYAQQCRETGGRFSDFLNRPGGGNRTTEIYDTIVPRDITVSASLVFFILSTELIIRWNNIQNVNTIGSTGQLLPLIAAILSFVRVVYKFSMNYIKGHPDHPDIELKPQTSQGSGV